MLNKQDLNKLNNLLFEQQVEEGLGSIATSKLADLARSFIFKARPIVILHHPGTDSTVTIKLKRGLLKHTLYAAEGKNEKVIGKSISGILLLTKALNESRKLIAAGYVEI